MSRVFTPNGNKRQHGTSTYKISALTLIRVNNMLTNEWEVKKYFVDSYPSKRDWSSVAQSLKILVSLGLADTKGTGRGAVFYRKNPHLTNPKKLREELITKIKKDFNNTHNTFKKRRKYSELYNEYRQKMVKLKNQINRNIPTEKVNDSKNLWSEYNDKLFKKHFGKRIKCDCGYIIENDNVEKCLMCLKEVKKNDR